MVFCSICRDAAAAAATPSSTPGNVSRPGGRRASRWGVSVAVPATAEVDATATSPPPAAVEVSVWLGDMVCARFVLSILAAVPPIKARRALHFAVYLEDCTCSEYFSVQLEQTGVTTGGGKRQVFF